MIEHLPVIAEGGRRCNVEGCNLLDYEHGPETWGARRKPIALSSQWTATGRDDGTVTVSNGLTNDLFRWDGTRFVPVSVGSGKDVAKFDPTTEIALREAAWGGASRALVGLDSDDEEWQTYEAIVETPIYGYGPHHGVERDVFARLVAEGYVTNEDGETFASAEDALAATWHDETTGEDVPLFNIEHPQVATPVADGVEYEQIEVVHLGGYVCILVKVL